VVPDLQIHFEFNSAELTEQARLQLDQLGEALNKDALLSYSFQIGGHTDAAGSEVYNDWLSQERADAVVTYLAEQHQVDPGRLDPVGFGERQLFDPSQPRGGMNRRVEVRTLQ
jgi:outer membrane protein OmpA-like peptidoglycan-associated protein